MKNESSRRQGYRIGKIITKELWPFELYLEPHKAVLHGINTDILSAGCSKQNKQTNKRSRTTSGRIGHAGGAKVQRWRRQANYTFAICTCTSGSKVLTLDDPLLLVVYRLTKLCFTCATFCAAPCSHRHRWYARSQSNLQSTREGLDTLLWVETQ